MRIALIADTFPPLRTSGAVQLRDLSREFVRQGHELTVFLASPEIDRPWVIDAYDGARIVRLKTPVTKDIGYVRRTLHELRMPFSMCRNIDKSPVAADQWDGVVWYSPTIFLGPVANKLKTASDCPAYLIIRDIFPEWAVDMGLMGRGLPYHFFSKVARYQYAVADVIGVQTPGNLAYFETWQRQSNRQLQVLQNWLGSPADMACSIDIEKTPLAGRRIFVYAGNMGVAQGMDKMLDLAEHLRHRDDLGFLFVGRGRDARRLRVEAERRALDHVMFHDEIDPGEIPNLYKQCHVGLVSLDPRHQTHNIPGKFLTYMQSGLPVLASVNPGNDLIDLIRKERVGVAVRSDRFADLTKAADDLVETLEQDPEIADRCRALCHRLFSVEAAVRQIVTALQEAG